MIPWWGWLIISLAGFTVFAYSVYFLMVVVFFNWVKKFFED